MATRYSEQNDTQDKQPLCGRSAVGTLAGVRRHCACGRRPRIGLSVQSGYKQHFCADTVEASQLLLHSPFVLRLADTLGMDERRCPKSFGFGSRKATDL